MKIDKDSQILRNDFSTTIEGDKIVVEYKGATVTLTPVVGEAGKVIEYEINYLTKKAVKKIAKLNSKISDMKLEIDKIKNQNLSDEHDDASDTETADSEDADQKTTDETDSQDTVATSDEADL